ncbi:type I toxin-antitoxin system ptaRNA1 family toxin [Vibrio fluvialis]|uniref:type I toxin-antitoxin system ptaRNA1 family toxin n=1 Tax=Vibrio fluvialis TaxID=676 RepID=UPI00192BD01B|nr:type I toxin-antitoxin system ptaRNA1 family toxin [Vibrio fluvialis]MBL4245200.1 type I toxin-antitoxin system ptaRNA1 family toxin [Vibrio fluvialis]MBL4253919.1 type I toxin-antitoxin system ptaRNA1 family toxin [Vibrio fluvialis]
MTTTHNIEVQQVIHQAATELAALEFIDQETARKISPVAEAVANMFTILYYQAETGRATPEDFEQALDTIRHVTRNQGKR